MTFWDQGDYKRPLKPKNSKSITFTVRGGFFTFWASWPIVRRTIQKSGGGSFSNVVGIICPPVWNRENWEGKLPRLASASLFNNYQVTCKFYLKHFDNFIPPFFAQYWQLPVPYFQCISGVTEDILSKGYKLDQVKAIGITNQRETTVAWHKTSGLPLQYFNSSWNLMF